jgi:hypothetical protein
MHKEMAVEVLEGSGNLKAHCKEHRMGHRLPLTRMCPQKLQEVSMPAKFHDDKRRHTLFLNPEHSHKVWMPEPAVNASLEQQLRQSLPTLRVGNLYSHQAVDFRPPFLLFARYGGEAGPEWMLRRGSEAGLIHHPELAVTK